ncbi:MAG: 23S rRNA (guanosine2251-2'-O)-methyltransferase [Alphaproteobacteria bacterium]|jgi:23S rRNA (guanosine2251-2'-O)-methyltransferase
MTTWIFGHHAVEGVIKAGKRKVHELLITQQHVDRYAEYKPKLKGARVDTVHPRELNKKFPDKVHQGVAAEVGELKEFHLEDIIGHARLLLILDQVTDQRNIGACLRSANAFGCDAVLIPAHGSGGLNDVAVKASVGACEYTPVIEVGNLNKTMDLLKKEGFWTVGLDGYADKELCDVDLTGKMAIVMGSEGDGLRDLVKKNCDFTAKLPMGGEVESLNVSVATGISLYEACKQRKK